MQETDIHPCRRILCLFRQTKSSISEVIDGRGAGAGGVTPFSSREKRNFWGRRLTQRSTL